MGAETELLPRDCLGYLEDLTQPRSGLVFRFPPEYDENNQVHTTYQILAANRALFSGERFRLATFLSESLHELHMSGWFHKSIGSFKSSLLETVNASDQGRFRNAAI